MGRLRYNVSNQFTASDQLQALLGLGKKLNEFKRIKDCLREIRLKNLLDSQSAGSQLERFVRIERQLKELLPDYFGPSCCNHNQKLQLALRVIRHLHRGQRISLSKYRGKENLIDLTSLESDSEIEEIPNLTPIAPPPTPCVLNVINIAQQDVPPQKSTSPKCRMKQPKTEFSLKSTASSYKNSRASKSGSNELSHIHAFLSSCSPPLDHLLSRFVDLGFKSSSILLEVASRWTQEERHRLLMKLSRGPNGAAVTELELAALEKKFSEYV